MTSLDAAAAIRVAARPHKSKSTTGRSQTVRDHAGKNLRLVDVCSYCGQPGDLNVGPDGAPWHLDHVVPLAKGGEDATWNIVKACAFCNTAKGVKLWVPKPGALNGDGNEWRAPDGSIEAKRSSQLYVPLSRTRHERDLMARQFGASASATNEGEHNLAEVQRLAAEQGQIWWLSQDLGDLIARASRGMPEFELHPEHLPDESGVCFLEFPMLGSRPFLNHQSDYVHVSAVTWTVCHTVDEDGNLLTILYTMTHAKIAETEDGPVATSWVPVAFAGWAFGRVQGDFAGIPGQVLPTAVDDLNWLAAVWSISEQDRYVTCDTEPAPRAERRRAARANRVSDVRVIRLRSTQPSRQTNERADTSGYSHRFLVSGHWKMQPFGPKQSLRKPVYIDEYIKGPEGKPLVVKETIKAVLP